MIYLAIALYLMVGLTFFAFDSANGSLRDGKEGGDFVLWLTIWPLVSIVISLLLIFTWVTALFEGGAKAANSELMTTLIPKERK